MDYLIMSILMFRLNLVAECNDSSCSILHIQYQAYFSQLNYFPLLSQLNRVDYYDSIQLVLSVYLSELSMFPYSLFMMIIWNPVLFPSPPLGRW